MHSNRRISNWKKITHLAWSWCWKCSASRLTTQRTDWPQDEGCRLRKWEEQWLPPLISKQPPQLLLLLLLPPPPPACLCYCRPSRNSATAAASVRHACWYAYHFILAGNQTIGHVLTYQASKASVLSTNRIPIWHRIMDVLSTCSDRWLIHGCPSSHIYDIHCV